MTMSRMKSACMAAMALLLVATSPALARPKYAAVESADKVGKGDTLIVGRIVLVPPLLEGEQDLRKFVGDTTRVSARHLARYRDKAFLVLDENGKYELRNELDVYKRETLVPLEKTFFVKAGKGKSLYALASGLVMCGSEATRERAYLPAGYKVRIGSKDRAVYIGTIVYHRDEFMRVNKVEVRDEFQSAQKELRQKFGKGFRLRKALIRPE